MAGATDPVFCVTPHTESNVLNATIETALDVPTKTVTVFTPGANGSLLLEIDAEVIFTTLAPITVAALIYVFLLKAGVYSLFDTIPVTAVTAAAAGPAPWRATPKTYYPGIPLPSGTTVVASASVAPTSGTYKVTCIGLDA